MPLSLLDVDWLNQNANRSYPIDEEAGGRDLSGAFALPKSFLVDLLWPVHSAFSHDCTRFYLSSVVTAGNTIVGALGYAPPDGTDVVAAGSFVVDRTRHTRNRVYNIVGTGEFQDSVGRVAVGDIEELYQQGGGLEFNLAGARIVPVCIRPNLRGVSALTVRNGNDTSGLLTGDCELVAGRGIRLMADGNTIRIDAVAAADLEEDCGCADTRSCIQTINGVGPDENGDFRLVGDECLTIEELENGLRLVDKCSRSCCGCDELRVVTDAAEAFGEQLNRLELGLDRVEAQLANAVANILASRTNADGC